MFKSFLGPHRSVWWQRAIDQMNICRSQGRRDRRVLQALQQALVELLIGLEFVAQHIVLHQQLIQSAYFLLLLGNPGSGKSFAVARRPCSRCSSG